MILVERVFNVGSCIAFSLFSELITRSQIRDVQATLSVNSKRWILLQFGYNIWECSNVLRFIELFCFTILVLYLTWSYVKGISSLLQSSVSSSVRLYFLSFKGSFSLVRTQLPRKSISLEVRRFQRNSTSQKPKYACNLRNKYKRNKSF